MKFALPPSASASRLPSLGSLPSVSVRRNGGWWFCNKCHTQGRSSPVDALLSKRQYHGTYYLRNSKTSRQNINASETLNAATRNNTSSSSSSSKRTRAIRLAAAGGTVAVALFAFWDDIKHTYAAAERTSRVVTALAICINE